MKQVTQGSVNREKEINLKKQQQNEKLLQQQKVKIQERIDNERFGEYKNLVIKTYLEFFGNNYGDRFDYNSLIQSLTFSKNIDKHKGTSFEFQFNEKTLIFKSEAEEQYQKFNENSYIDFISNNDEVSGKNVSRYLFDNSEEYEAYENNDVLDSDIDILDGEFIPVSNNADRYGEFNRINKLVGYSPAGETSKTASKRIKEIWSTKYK